MSINNIGINATILAEYQKVPRRRLGANCRTEVLGDITGEVTELVGQIVFKL